MAHFFGIVKGSAYTTATRNGDKGTGLGTTATSPQGAVTVDLYHTEGIDMARICLTPWKGYGLARVLHHGPVSGRKIEEIEEADANTEEYRRPGENS